MSDPSIDRPKNREVENEEVKPTGSGEPPRTVREPQGVEDSAGTAPTRTDPASGEHEADTEDSGDAGPKELRDTPKVG